MTLIERLKALYSGPLDNSETCDYCGRKIGNHEEHDELCVWKVTQEAIAALEAFEVKLARGEEVILNQVRNLGARRAEMDALARDLTACEKNLADAQSDIAEEIAERKLLAQWVRDHFPHPLDHNAECLFCDEQFGHAPQCPWCE